MTVALPLFVSPRFCGPPGMGNGGYVCGLVAEAIKGPAQVRLRLPTPLDTPLRLASDGASARLFEGELLLVEGERFAPPLDLVPPPRPIDADIAAARPHFPTRDSHMAPFCFVCGVAREPADALCLFTGRHPDSGHAIAHWSPAADLADDAGLVETRYLWAALDCPSYFTLGHHHRVALLAGMSAEVVRRPAPGEALTVTGWTLAHDGRKHHSASVIHDADGHAIAMAKALWVDIGAVGA
jgi:hypothetical protein